MAFESVSGMIAGLTPGMIALIVITSLWKLSWYGVALYKSAKMMDKAWFVVLFLVMIVFNDLGIVAIIYLIIKSNRKNTGAKSKSTNKNTKKK